MYMWIIIFIVSSLLFIFSIIFVFHYHFLEISKWFKPEKNIFIYKFNLSERNLYIEKSWITNKKNLNILNFNKKNMISSITNYFSDKNSKRFSEIFNNLDNGSKMERFVFIDKSFYSNNENANYDFTFYKIENSFNYFLIFKFNHIRNKNKDFQKRNIPKITKKDILNNKNIFKGFVVFDIKENIDESIDTFLNSLKFKKNAKNIFYMKQNSIFILIILHNKRKKVEKVISSIKNQVDNESFSNEFKYLYNGSSIAISKKTNSIKHINQIFQTLSFLITKSIKTKNNFLSPKDINKNYFKIYNESLNIFNHSIKNQTFNVDTKSVLNINNNKKVLDYLLPNIKKINISLFKEIITDLNNKKELVNSFAKKILTKDLQNPIMIDVYDEWLNENMDIIKNKKALLIIHFVKMKENIEKLEFIKKVNHKKISFVFFIKNCNEKIVSIVQKCKPKFILISDKIWSQDKFLSSNQFAKLITLNRLTIKNEIRIIYKNPIFTLDKKTYEDIGLKYYFKS